MIDWNLIETIWIATVVVCLTAGFILSAFVRLIFYELVANPSVQAIVRAAQKWGGGKGGGVGEKILEKGFKWLFG